MPHKDDVLVKFTVPIFTPASNIISTLSETRTRLQRDQSHSAWRLDREEARGGGD